MNRNDTMPLPADPSRKGDCDKCWRKINGLRKEVTDLRSLHVVDAELLRARSTALREAGIDLRLAREETAMVRAERDTLAAKVQDQNYELKRHARLLAMTEGGA